MRIAVDDGLNMMVVAKIRADRRFLSVLKRIAFQHAVVRKGSMFVEGMECAAALARTDDCVTVVNVAGTVLVFDRPPAEVYVLVEAARVKATPEKVVMKMVTARWEDLLADMRTANSSRDSLRDADTNGMKLIPNRFPDPPEDQPSKSDMEAFLERIQDPGYKPQDVYASLSRLLEILKREEVADVHVTEAWRRSTVRNVLES